MSDRAARWGRDLDLAGVFTATLSGSGLWRVILLLPILLTSMTPFSAAGQEAPTLSAEEQLAQKFAPIAYLKRQNFPCDPGGEPYLPMPVDLVFGDPEVALRQFPGRAELKRNLAPGDLFQADAANYLDLPGDPREPGCTYERHANQRAKVLGATPTVYAHVATEEVAGELGLALQYWFWYDFNDFNDKHESDWEMIQLRFAAGSAEEALGQEPVAIALSQHTGGETAPWDSAKLLKEDGRPVTYPSRGSHGNYYGPAVWLGWGEDGSGLGCDDTTGPSVRVEPKVIYVPDQIGGSADPFAWATFEGYWGEREMWVYDGPRGPNAHPQWDRPISWQAGLRDSSLKLRDGDAVGPSPTTVFCTATRVSSDLYAQLQLRPWIAGGVILALTLLAGWLIVLAWPIMRSAWTIWTSELGTFLKIGAVLIPVGWAANGLHALIATVPPISTLLEITERAPIVSALISLVLGNLTHLAMLALVGPAVVQATTDVQAGRPPSARRAFAAVRVNVRAIASATARLAVVVGLLAISVVGLPWAMLWAVRWGFFGQATIQDGAKTGSEALEGSARVVRGRWWRALGIGGVLVVVGAALGPALAIPVLILFDAPLELVNGFAGFVYAVTHPFAVIGGTILYQRLTRATVPADGTVGSVAVRPAGG